MDLGPNRIVETRERDPRSLVGGRGAAPRPRPPATGRHSWTRDPGFPRYAGLSTEQTCCSGRRAQDSAVDVPHEAARTRRRRWYAGVRTDCPSVEKAAQAGSTWRAKQSTSSKYWFEMEAVARLWRFYLWV
ncbi:hypothetical protein E4U43_002835 [Claviceps pusilla]|uniref:Uncharacterized protein n=1 Tax=Claviceps pusilla TaxID=123648 RepID=A0A9P7N5P4_9HYPO|nr:hypothetical protein E4U43_002835 [Claviceps pusilla]